MDQMTVCDVKAFAPQTYRELSPVSAALSSMAPFHVFQLIVSVFTAQDFYVLVDSHSSHRQLFSGTNKNPHKNSNTK